MRIYKYVSAPTLREMLRGQLIRFTFPADFNDPFDRPRVLRSPFMQSVHDIWGGSRTNEEIAQEEDEQWGRCAICSFTRTFDNALMWSHYADSHRGAVIELNAERAGLTWPGLLIPVQFGSVIYLKRPNRDRYDRGRLPTFKSGDQFDLEDYERLQRLFLSKPLSWAYEEEVRAVVRTDGFGADGRGLDGNWKMVRPEGQAAWWGRRLESGAITRIFVGARYPDLEWLKTLRGDQRFAIRQAALSPDEYEMAFEDVEA